MGRAVLRWLFYGAVAGIFIVSMAYLLEGAPAPFFISMFTLSVVVGFGALAALVAMEFQWVPKELRLASRVRAALNRLGDTPAAVADTLVSLGINGVQFDCGHCPISRYLDRAIADRDWEYRVGVESVTCLRRGTTHFFTVTLPYPVFLFRKMYDRGAFPELCAPRVEGKAS